MPRAQARGSGEGIRLGLEPIALAIGLTVGLIGISVSFFLGILLGSIAGYFGGRIDWV